MDLQVPQTVEMGSSVLNNLTFTTMSSYTPVSSGVSFLEHTQKDMTLNPSDL